MVLGNWLVVLGMKKQKLGLAAKRLWKRRNETVKHRGTRELLKGGISISGFINYDLLPSFLPSIHPSIHPSILVNKCLLSVLYPRHSLFSHSYYILEEEFNFWLWEQITQGGIWFGLEETYPEEVSLRSEWWQEGPLKQRRWECVCVCLCVCV